MWSDAETELDYLNYSEVAEMIAELIDDPSLLPLSLGIFGGWGTGKSSMLKLVELELDKTPNKYLVIRFDAWLYQDFDDARAALMGVISSALIEAVPETMKERAVGLLGRVNKLRLLGLLVEGGAMALGAPAFGAISKGVDAAGMFLSDNPETADVAAIKNAASNANSVVTELINPAEESGGPPEQINAFRTEFSEILTHLDKTLVVFIDNLDRCLPENAIHTLEAIRLFLFMPKTAFVVAADEDMIRHAVAQHFHNPSQRHVADYLDKLIQMPVRVPRVGIQEIRSYLFLLLSAKAGISENGIELLRQFLIEKLRNSWRQEGDFSVGDVVSALKATEDSDLIGLLEMADRIAPTLALSPGVLGNPRTVKRMLNVVRMRSSVARRRSMPLDEAMITKLALFERCTDIHATEGLHNLINASSHGKPELLRQLESANPRGEALTLPDVWVKHSEFIFEWSKLPPALSGIDLRPAVYLARETVPLRISSSTSSPAVFAAVENLIRVSSISSPAAKSSLDSLKAEEFEPVMEALISEMRKDSEWRRARADFRGAVITANRSQAAADILSRFIRSLQLVKIPGWMSTMLKNTTWWKD